MNNGQFAIPSHLLDIDGNKNLNLISSKHLQNASEVRVPLTYQAKAHTEIPTSQTYQILHENPVVSIYQETPLTEVTNTTNIAETFTAGSKVVKTETSNPTDSSKLFSNSKKKIYLLQTGLKEQSSRFACVVPKDDSTLLSKIDVLDDGN